MKSPGARNEALDCTVYAVFCTHMLGLHLYTGKMWERMESIVQPPNGDLFRVEQTEEVPPVDVPRETQSQEKPPQQPVTESSATSVSPLPAASLPPPMPPPAAAVSKPPRRTVQRPSRKTYLARTW
jgi:phage terminase large subunit GpA-like protein